MKASYRIYRDLFSQSECAMLDSCPLDSAVSEISLIRIQLRRVLGSFRNWPLGKGLGKRASSEHWPSRGHRAAGQTSRPQSKRSQRKSLTLERYIAMLITFNTTGIVLASLVRYHRYFLTSGLYIDPELEAFAAPDDCNV